MDIKNIPIPGIKGLINYKLLEMKDLNIIVDVYVSDSVASIKNNNLDIKEKNNLYTILGVILDNAIEASLESDDKMVSLQFFKEDDEINIILANTFKNINLDYLDKKGFSTKGENRGIGLYLVKEIIKHSECIKKETSIINNFFVQKIIIKSTK
jgi:two-component system sensor histidine kinase AgrC